MTVAVIGLFFAGAGVIIAALGVRSWRRAGQVLDAILRDEDPR